MTETIKMTVNNQNDQNERDGQNERIQQYDCSD